VQWRTTATLARIKVNAGPVFAGTLASSTSQLPIRRATVTKTPGTWRMQSDSMCRFALPTDGRTDISLTSSARGLAPRLVVDRVPSGESREMLILLETIPPACSWTATRGRDIRCHFPHRQYRPDRVLRGERGLFRRAATPVAEKLALRQRDAVGVGQQSRAVHRGVDAVTLRKRSLDASLAGNRYPKNIRAVQR
jgi:hypothetical protein